MHVRGLGRGGADGTSVCWGWLPSFDLMLWTSGGRDRCVGRGGGRKAGAGVGQGSQMGCTRSTRLQREPPVDEVKREHWCPSLVHLTLE
jgi:hypothetical protein